MTKYDSLGRKIPEFDRSAANKKGAKTKKDKYGKDHFGKVARSGSNSPRRGYFGHLKDTGQIDKLKKMANEGAKKRWDKSCTDNDGNNSSNNDE